jgi:hypothetical protein
MQQDAVPAKRHCVRGLQIGGYDLRFAVGPELF